MRNIILVDDDIVMLLS